MPQGIAPVALYKQLQGLAAFDQDAQNLVDAGNRRAAAAGLSNLRFQEGDASDLNGVADASFDLTL